MATRYLSRKRRLLNELDAMTWGTHVEVLLALRLAAAKLLNHELRRVMHGGPEEALDILEHYDQYESFKKTGDIE